MLSLSFVQFFLLSCIFSLLQLILSQLVFAIFEGLLLIAAETKVVRSLGFSTSADTSFRNVVIFFEDIVLVECRVKRLQLHSIYSLILVMMDS